MTSTNHFTNSLIHYSIVIADLVYHVFGKLENSKISDAVKLLYSDFRIQRNFKTIGWFVHFSKESDHSQNRKIYGSKYRVVALHYSTMLTDVFQVSVFYRLLFSDNWINGSWFKLEIHEIE